MDDNQDITAEKPEESAAAANPAQYEQQEPPIVRPEDVMGTPELSTAPELPSYAPQPDAVAGGSQETWAEQMPVMTVEAPIQAEAQADYNPAMVPDPLLSGDTAATDPEILAENALYQSAVGPDLPRKQPSTHLIRNIAIAVVSVIVILVGGFFGFQLYAKASNAHILETAFANLSNTKGATNVLTVGSDGVSLSGKLDIDQSQNLRFGASFSGINASVIYLKDKDRLYISDLLSGSTKNFTEFDSVKKGAESISAKTVNISNTNRLSNDFVADDMKSVTRDSDESVSGMTLYKFTITPAKSLRDKLVADLTAGDSSSAVKLASDAFTADIWIDPSSMNITRIKGEATVSAALDSTGSAGSSAKLTFEDNIGYAFKDTIKLPIGSKVTTKLNFANILSSGLVESSTTSSADTNTNTSSAVDEKDTKLMTNAGEIQTALEAYFADNSEYPTSLDALFTASTPLLTDKTVADDITYFTDGKAFELSFVLGNQSATETENVKTVSGKKVYYLVSADNTTDTAE